jgi:hypothetical protein
MATNVGSPVQPCPLNKKKEPLPIQDPFKHWINFNIKDDSGKPVANVTIQVVLPDGSVEEHTSDEKGIIEIKNIEPGTCKIKSDWKEITVNDAVLIK